MNSQFMDGLLALIGSGAVTALVGVAVNVRNAWKQSIVDAVARERHHQEQMEALRLADARLGHILEGLIGRVDNTEENMEDVRQRLARIESTAMSRKA